MTRWMSLKKSDYSRRSMDRVMALRLMVLGALLLGNVLVLRHSYAASSDNDIGGVWRPVTAKDCSDALMIIDRGQISFASKSVKPVTIDFNVVIFNPPHAVGPVLLFHPNNEGPGILMLMQTEIADGGLSFGEAVWSQPAIATYGDALNAPGMTALLENMRRGNPYHRCPN